MDVGLLSVPEFRSKFDSAAGKVKLGDNAHESVDAALIPRDAIAAEAVRLP